MTRHLRFLVAESEPAEARRRRRESVGRSSGETYVEMLGRLEPGAESDRITPADPDGERPATSELAAYDAVFLTGSPLHLYDETPETLREIEFMRAVFAAGVPAFGSCAGLQVATVAAGGRVRPMRRDSEVAFARRVTATDLGAHHPLLAGRPRAWDAPAIHSDEVERLPDRASLLATNAVTEVQAAEIHHDQGVFWGVQYHPEISLREVAAAVKRQSDDLVSQGFADNAATLNAHAELIENLGAAPDRRDLAWRLGLDDQVTDEGLRTRELSNFIQHLVLPTRSARGRE